MFFWTAILGSFNDSKTNQKKFPVNQILLVFKREKNPHFDNIRESIHLNKNIGTEATLGNEKIKNL